MPLTPAPAPHVHFSSIVTTLAAGGETSRHFMGHQSASNDPFIASGHNAATSGSTGLFSSNTQVCFYFYGFKLHRGTANFYFFRIHPLMNTLISLCPPPHQRTEN
jgi:hypothetical protein